MYHFLNRRTGFTLIELLIVVAIIAILAAIAVPNFLEAQTRAKVSRVRADVRTVATAMETYKIDNNTYPPPGEYGRVAINRWPNDLPAGFHSRIPSWLTTPVAHMNSLPNDIFLTTKNTNPAWDRYIYFPYEVFVKSQGASVSGVTSAQNQQTGGYLFYSFGPDGDDNQPAPNGKKPGRNGTWTRYDASNGTISLGNIIRTAKSPEGEIPAHPGNTTATTGPN